MGSVCVCVIAAWLTVNLIVLLVALHCGWRGSRRRNQLESVLSQRLVASCPYRLDQDFIS